jgi:hypothetical protein
MDGKVEGRLSRFMRMRRLEIGRYIKLWIYRFAWHFYLFSTFTCRLHYYHLNSAFTRVLPNSPLPAHLPFSAFTAYYQYCFKTCTGYYFQLFRALTGSYLVYLSLRRFRSPSPPHLTCSPPSPTWVRKFLLGTRAKGRGAE